MDKQSTSCSLYSVYELARFLAGDLSSRRQKRLERHLESCPVCQQKLHELTVVQKVLRQAPDVPLPRSFTLSPEAVRGRRRPLWYPVLRATTAAAATVVLVLLLGGLLQPGLLVPGTPTPRAIGIKSTPLVAPTPLPVAVAPASTWRPRPTLPGAGQSTIAAPTVGQSEIYPQPVAAGPRIEATVARPAGPAPATTTAANPTAALWSAIHLGGLALLGVLAGLTWLAYRRERAFFS